MKRVLIGLFTAAMVALTAAPVGAAFIPCFGFPA